MSPPDSPTLGFIGAGRIGTALAWGLARKGYAVTAVASRSRDSAARLAAGIAGCRAMPDPQSLADHADLVLLTVPDDAIAATCAALDWRAGQAVVHCSGATELLALAPAASSGAYTGGFHPLQMFTEPETALRGLPGCTIAVEAEQPLLATLCAMAESLGCHTLRLTPEKPFVAVGEGITLIAAPLDPILVVLDEPFSGLDPVNQQVMEDIIRDIARRGRTVLFSTHVMQHAERLCDRILLIAKGRKLFDGTIAGAKRLLPRRVRIETEDPVTALSSLPEVISTRPVEAQDAMAHRNGSVEYELELREDADPQAILQACFTEGIRLKSFNQSDPTLHEVFVRVVGSDAKEAAFR